MNLDEMIDLPHQHSGKPSVYRFVYENIDSVYELRFRLSYDDQGRLESCKNLNDLSIRYLLYQGDTMVRIDEYLDFNLIRTSRMRFWEVPLDTLGDNIRLIEQYFPNFEFYYPNVLSHFDGDSLIRVSTCNEQLIWSTQGVVEDEFKYNKGNCIGYDYRVESHTVFPPPPQPGPTYRLNIEYTPLPNSIYVPIDFIFSKCEIIDQDQISESSKYPQLSDLSILRIAGKDMFLLNTNLIANLDDMHFSYSFDEDNRVNRIDAGMPGSTNSMFVEIQYY